MDYDLRSFCHVDAKRLVLLIVLIFTSAIAVQYFELPYSTAIRSLFSGGKSQGTEINTFYDQNGTYIGHSNNRVSNVSEGNNFGAKNDSVLEKDGGSDGTLELDENRFDPEDEASSKDSIQLADSSIIEKKESTYSVSPNLSPSPSPSPLNSIFNMINRTNVNITPTPVSSEGKDTGNTFQTRNKSEELQNNMPTVKKEVNIAKKGPVSISNMNDLLIQSRASFSMKPRWSSRVDKELWNAKLQIENSPVVDNHPGLYAPLFRNVSMFKRSYELMEQMLKVYIYKEGNRPIFHTPVLKGIYASEGWFMKLLKANKQFITKSPQKAHLFYLPFSSRMLEETLYVPDSHSHKNLIKCLKDYIDMISGRYSFWNRTGGADHFLVACHDWAPAETRQIMANCIRALCNSDLKEGFKFGKDVSLPETYVRNPQNPLRELGGKRPSQRKILSFFAGSMHGYLRPILLQFWENKDPDMKIFGQMPKSKGNSNYIHHMKTSKFCICAKGYEVNSPRVVEAIFYECVPVIISDDFVPPFFGILNWESFAVFILEKDIPNLKNILLSIPSKRYLEMHKRVKQVQQHFLWNVKPVKYDIFHMLLHSIWYNRVFQMRPI